ncbi:uncharacterized protein LOC115970327 [Quercus lobata]|uniref:uncharacterized protein LOC115970327 n=1 Tax=Quercus lobata TaxID=97700 RepID=UPI0012468C69|nr:uncharacterized protein LOC115970327 [Quercus lobata]
MDLGYRGPKFTWFRRNGEEAGIFERLDRGVANPAWINTFHEGYIQHLTTASSDHRPIILRTKNRDKGRNRPLTSEGCEDAVRNSWDKEERDGDMENLLERIQLCSWNLGEWSKRDFGEITNLLQEKKKKLHKLGEEPRTEDIVQQEADLRREVNVLLIKEEKMWHQRSRINWLQSGDQNTKFFHTHASRRKRGNWIQGIEDNDGVWHEDIDKIEDVAAQYFTNLFTSMRPQLDE